MCLGRYDQRALNPQRDFLWAWKSKTKTRTPSGPSESCCCCSCSWSLMISSRRFSKLCRCHWFAKSCQLVFITQTDGKLQIKSKFLITEKIYWLFSCIFSLFNSICSILDDSTERQESQGGRGVDDTRLLAEMESTLTPCQWASFGFQFLFWEGCESHQLPVRL